MQQDANLQDEDVKSCLAELIIVLETVKKYVELDVLTAVVMKSSLIRAIIL
jgi:uncharacterized protein YejL (UPF0352 family)